MRLENVCIGSKGVMDVKLGAITWDKFASEQKIEAEKAKYPWREQLAFRILGFRVRHFLTAKSLTS